MKVLADGAIGLLSDDRARQMRRKVEFDGVPGPGPVMHRECEFESSGGSEGESPSSEDELDIRARNESPIGGEDILDVGGKKYLAEASSR